MIHVIHPDGTGENGFFAVVNHCPNSPYKDERHEWRTRAYEEHGLAVMRGTQPRPEYYVKQCRTCLLTVLLLGDPGSFNEAPRKEDRLICAFTENPR